MSNTQLVVLSVADERSARDLSSILYEIDRRDENVSIIDAAIAMKDFRGKPQIVQLKKAVETRGGSLFGGITSVFREKGIDEAILRKKAQIMEPGQVSLFVLYTGTWDKSRRALRHALRTFGIEFTDEKKKTTPDKTKDDMAYRPPMRRGDSYGNGSYASGYDAGYDDDMQTSFEGETFGSSIDWPSSDKITVWTELEGDDPYFGEDSASYDDEPIFGEESAVADITDDYRERAPFYRQADEDTADDELEQVVSDEQPSDELIDEPVAESPSDGTEADEVKPPDTEDDISLYRGLGDVAPTEHEDWLIDEVTKFDAIAEATRAALIAGATQSAKVVEAEDAPESVEEAVDEIADVVDETDEVDQEQGEALLAVSADIAEHGNQIRSYGSLQRETGLELVEIAAELEEFSQEVREQELALLSAVLSNRGEKLYALAREMVASASSASELAATLDGASEAIELASADELAE